MRIVVFKAAMATLAAALFLVPAPQAGAQGLFEPVIKVNEQAVTRFEIEQRARMLTLFRTPGDPIEIAREQLVEDRLKLGAAKVDGIQVTEEVVDAAMEEFAQRGNMSANQMVQSLGAAGVDESSFRAFVRAGVTWREVVRAKFGNTVDVSEEDMERAKLAMTGTSGVTVLLSEIVLPIPQGGGQEAMARAEELARITSLAEFAAAARRYSASPSADSGGQMGWTSVDELPEPLRPVVLGLSPGEVSAPLPTERAIVLLQLRDIAETAVPTPRYSSIEYAMYYIAGGQSQEARQRAANVEADVDVCDDLYGIAKGQPPEVLAREKKAPNEIPQDVARELANLDPGEVSTRLTRSNGQTLVFLMLCERTPIVDGGEGPTAEQLTNFIRNRQLDSLANGYLEQLRAEARIVELR
ncbi:peptidylprolyl isomerase [Roseovarius sp.]|uniref:peptidylprolyl isomerase n=1 Tax=Roseovarius sp. TaxID=1486281 RepID=UPI003BAD23FE